MKKKKRSEMLADCCIVLYKDTVGIRLSTHNMTMGIFRFSLKSIVLERI